jgi:hypothetical protein
VLYMKGSHGLCFISALPLLRLRASPGVKRCNFNRWGHRQHQCLRQQPPLYTGDKRLPPLTLRSNATRLDTAMLKFVRPWRIS